MAANRKAPRLKGSDFSYVDARTIEDAAHIYVGEMVEQDDSTLEVAPATNASGKLVLGVATVEVDNTDDGEVCRDIETSVLGMDNDGSITKDKIGDLAYVLDASTVSVSASVSANIAGPIVEVSSDYVFVDFDPAKKN